LAQEIPTFARWLLDHVRIQMANGVVVNPDMVVYFRPPSTSAYTYNNMWAYGNHYKVDVETWPTHATYDSGVACIFMQGSCSYVQDKNIVMANLHYVGVLKEIIVVSYTSQCVTFVKCSWILIHTQRNAAIVQQDEHGFWVVNHG
jgi:hypothetical protein